jgi:hypothetical protein
MSYKICNTSPRPPVLLEGSHSPFSFLFEVAFVVLSNYILHSCSHLRYMFNVPRLFIRLQQKETLVLHLHTSMAISHLLITEMAL